nr:hypothetical protein CoNPh38_CDS0167 [Staphylococcus phage S-CoN_Ph38]
MLHLLNLFQKMVSHSIFLSIIGLHYLMVKGLYE